MHLLLDKIWTDATTWKRTASQNFHQKKLTKISDTSLRNYVNAYRSCLAIKSRRRYSYDTRKGRNPFLYLNGGQFHVNLPALTNTWPHKRHFIAQDSVARALHNEANTDNNPSESANCNLRWPPRLSRGIFTPRKEIFLPYPFSRHGTAIHPSSSPAIISSRRRIVCWFCIQMSRRPSLRCCRPPVDSDKPV